MQKWPGDCVCRALASSVFSEGLDTVFFILSPQRCGPLLCARPKAYTFGAHGQGTLVSLLFFPMVAIRDKKSP